MAKTICIDPVTRIEGHLAIRVEVEKQCVARAYSSGEMFRGFEMILKGRHPLDAQQITQRICGVCPVSHGIASTMAQEKAYGIAPPENGRLARNLILGANYIQSHILHFYHLSALDFLDITAIARYNGKDPLLVHVRNWVKSQLDSKMLYPAAPFLPRYAGDYIQNTELNVQGIRNYLDALDMRAQAHKLVALFGGKAPHVATLVPGGMTGKISASTIADAKAMVAKLQAFVNHAYLPDVAEVGRAFPAYFQQGKGCGNFLAYGVFPETGQAGSEYFPSGAMVNGVLEELKPGAIVEDVRHSLFSSPSGLRPEAGRTEPAPAKSGAYSWIKAPRYRGQVMEVGPLARLMVAYARNRPSGLKKTVDGWLKNLGRHPEDLVSVMGRHLARAMECKLVADRCAEWVAQLTPDRPLSRDFSIPSSGRGVGLTEAPRGALGHWLALDDSKIANYQCVVPTTWNCSPRDDAGHPGAVEQALEGLRIVDAQNPVEAARVVRSFDPCLACAVH